MFWVLWEWVTFVIFVLWENHLLYSFIAREVEFAWSDIREIVPFFPFVMCVLACALSNAHAYTVFSAIFPFAWRNVTSARPIEFGRGAGDVRKCSTPKNLKEKEKNEGKKLTNSRNLTKMSIVLFTSWSKVTSFQVGYPSPLICEVLMSPLTILDMPLLYSKYLNSLLK